jgi:hypothetical protein
MSGSSFISRNLDSKKSYNQSINQSIYGISKPTIFGFIHESSPYISVVYIIVIYSYCTEIIVHLVLPADSGSAKGSSSSGFAVHGLEDKAGIFSA